VVRGPIPGAGSPKTAAFLRGCFRKDEWILWDSSGTALEKLITTGKNHGASKHRHSHHGGLQRTRSGTAKNKPAGDVDERGIAGRRHSKSAPYRAKKNNGARHHPQIAPTKSGVDWRALWPADGRQGVPAQHCASGESYPSSTRQSQPGLAVDALNRHLGKRGHGRGGRICTGRGNSILLTAGNGVGISRSHFGDGRWVPLDSSVRRGEPPAWPEATADLAERCHCASHFHSKTRRGPWPTRPTRAGETCLRSATNCRDPSTQRHGIRYHLRSPLGRPGTITPGIGAAAELESRHDNWAAALSRRGPSNRATAAITRPHGNNRHPATLLGRPGE